MIDHFAILKVGPALTFARVKLCSLWRRLKKNWYQQKPFWSASGAGKRDARPPGILANHYHGDGNARRLARGYSYSDPCAITGQTARLMTLSLIWFVSGGFTNSAAADQPVSAAAVRKVRSGELQPTLRELIINHIRTSWRSTTQPVKANKQNKEETLCQILF